jgi:hypothetical protein
MRNLDLLWETHDDILARYHRVHRGGVPSFFGMEYYYDLGQYDGLYILRRKWAEDKVLLGTRRWLWLRPLCTAWDWMVGQYYYSLIKVVKFLERHGWMEREQGVKVLPSTLASWFWNSTKMKAVRAWLT